MFQGSVLVVQSGPLIKRNQGTAMNRVARAVKYIKGDFLTRTLWKMPVNGGEETHVLPSVVLRAFSLAKDGIYFIPGPGADQKSPVQFLSFATGKVKTVAPVSKPGVDLPVSSDGRFLLLTQFDEEGSDMMLVENFW